MLWHTSTGGMPVAAATFATAASMMGTYSSMEPNTGSRFTAAKQCPCTCSSRIHGFQKPRLHTKPWMKTTPRRPGTTASTRSGSARQRNGWRQQKTRGAVVVSPNHARASSPQVGRGAGSPRPAKRNAVNSAARNSEYDSTMTAKPATASARDKLQKCASHALAAISNDKVMTCCMRARAEREGIPRVSHQALPAASPQPGLGVARLDRLGPCMEAARKIRDAVAQVALLRQVALDDPALREAVRVVKRVQAMRFAGTYADL